MDTRAARGASRLLSRREWWDHVLKEIDASGVPMACATRMPWLDLAFEPVGLNGWRRHVPA